MNAMLNNTEEPEPLIRDGIFNTEKVLVDNYPSIEHGKLTAGQIARKQASEGGQLLQYLFSETSK